MAALVSLTAVFSLVTQRSSQGEERCVTRLKTAAREIMAAFAFFILSLLNCYCWASITLDYIVHSFLFGVGLSYFHMFHKPTIRSVCTD